MKRFKNILAVYNDNVGADDVLSHASNLAIANQADLTVIDIHPGESATLSELTERQKRLNRIVTSIRAEGLHDATNIVVAGTPFLEIIRQVLAAEHDLVIISAEPNTSFMSHFFGTAVTHLMRKCPCPVWVVNPGQPHRYENILACVNPPTVDDTELDQLIVDLALSLADKSGINPHIVHTWNVEGPELDRI